MDEALENYVKQLLDIARRAYCSGDIPVKASAMGLVDLVESEDLDEAREYWQTELTAKQQRLIPAPPASVEA